ncbi:MAG: pantetheine-phosphate adenylyltransferase [Prevotellaceae bacterium]|jgi:pantetheine-phosphate adenylyltransferase|nr:pantetheine-phosphate adenylyltransferase [Prevotellaceae bacterium]
MQKAVIFPGSFDPFTIGHAALVYRALQLFDEVVIAVGHNSEKRYMFEIEDRINMIDKVFANYPQVQTLPYKGLTVDLCRKLDVYFLIRGLRTSADFEFERAIGQVNKQLDVKIETVFMLVAPEHTAISSSIVRDIIINNGDVSQFIPQAIILEDYKRTY